VFTRATSPARAASHKFFVRARLRLGRGRRRRLAGLREAVWKTKEEEGGEHGRKCTTPTALSLEYCVGYSKRNSLSRSQEFRRSGESLFSYQETPDLLTSCCS
jgi:hypothetical protein